MSICIFQLLFVVERTVFDVLGRMYGIVVADGIQLIMVIVGVIGTYSYKPKYLVPYGTMQFLWLGWNAYLVCYYLEVGFLVRKQMWAYPLTLSFTSQDYFDKMLFTCNKTMSVAPDTMGYQTETGTEPDSIAVLLYTQDPNCIVRPLWFKLLQCAIQVTFSFFAMLYVCYIVYGYEEDDDCFDFIGGFDNYNPGYPEQIQTSKQHIGYSAVPTHQSPAMHMSHGGGGGGSSGPHNMPGSNNMIMQPLPGMQHHQAMMDSRTELYNDTRT